jgi:hypothetical protein
VRAGDEEGILNAMRAAVLMGDDELNRWRVEAQESVSAHTLRDGAERFVSFARQAVDCW